MRLLLTWLTPLAFGAVLAATAFGADQKPAPSPSPSPSPSPAPPTAPTAGGQSSAPPSASNMPFLLQHPQLRDLLFTEPPSPFLVGFGFSPLSLLPNRFAFSVSVFQMHWRSSDWDWEILNGSLGFAPGSDVHASRQFSVRTAPKYRVVEHVSVGPMIGYEYVSFPDIQAQIARGTLGTAFEPFSAGGVIYGAEVAETFNWKPGRLLRVTQSIYEQSYSITQATSQAWGTRFADNALNADPSSLQAGTVFQLDFSILF